MTATERFTYGAGRGLERAGPSSARGLALTRGWLTLVALLVLVMVTIGGATRLTGSGLSITEWKPISGAIPPLSPETWAAEFERYKQIPQYKLQNAGISLDEFKTLFWWEWGHRELGRFIGLVYALGFVAGLALGVIRGRLAAVLFGLGLLLGMQGLVGWIMVHSGLQEGMVAVAPVKLALHLVLACTFFASIVAVRGSLRAEPAAALHGPTRLFPTAVALLGLVFLQIALGALVAGNKAGLVYNTWPLMDGALVPPSASLFFESPWWINLLDNHLTVQFNHRISAYLLLAVALWHAFDVRRTVPKSPLSRSSHSLAGLVLVQAVLGIVTLLLVVPLWAGLAHQALAVIVLGVAVWNLMTAARVRAF
ncbi:MAG: COX15/CtaA family protein [Beijerinckiaceae bacterium]|nr:COX15/CtaA family protein [Beijerinckiaceae bacterium]